MADVSSSSSASSARQRSTELTSSADAKFAELHGLLAASCAACRAFCQDASAALAAIDADAAALQQSRDVGNGRIDVNSDDHLFRVKEATRAVVPLLRALGRARVLLAAEVDRVDPCVRGGDASSASPSSSLNGENGLTAETAGELHPPCGDESIDEVRSRAGYAVWDIGERLARIESFLAAVKPEAGDASHTSQLVRFARPIVAVKRLLSGVALEAGGITAENLRSVREERSCHLKIAEAKELKAMDVGGKSDPYVVVRLDDAEIARTPTVYKELNPIFLEEFDFDIGANVEDVVLDVFDWDRFGGPDRIGQVVVPVAQLQRESRLEKWFPLMPSSGDYHVEGDLGFKVAWLPTQGATSAGAAGTLRVTVKDATNLKSADINGLSDPYCVVHLGDVKKFKTKTIKKSLNPRWDETFEFVVDLAVLTSRASLDLEFVVWDWDRVGSDDFLGRVRVPLSTLIVDTSLDAIFESRLRLKPKSIPPGQQKLLGSLRASFHFTQQTVLPNSAYQRFADVLRRSDFELAMALGEASGANGEFLTALMRFFCAQNDDIHFLRRAIKEEVRSTQSPGTIFRGNSVASKSLDCYQKILASNLLVRTLKPIIEDLYAAGAGKKDKLLFELDQSRPDGVSGAANLRSLSDFSARTWTAIQATRGSLPDALRVVYAIIREEVIRHFGGADGVDVVRYTAPSGFLFLRFFCPAILGPMSFGLAQSQPPSEACARNLTLLSKTMMNLGNLVEFGQKEPFMQPMNPFIQRELATMRMFLDEVCSFPASVQGDPDAQDSIERTFSQLLASDRCAARITVLVREILPKLTQLPEDKRPNAAAIARLQAEVDHLTQLGIQAVGH